MTSVYIVTKQNKFYCDVAGSSSTITYCLPIPLYNNTFSTYYVETTISSVNGSTTFTDYTNYTFQWGKLPEATYLTSGVLKKVAIQFDRAINFSSYPTTDSIVSKINLYSDSTYSTLVTSADYDFSITYVNHDSATSTVASYDFTSSTSGWTATTVETFHGTAPTLTLTIDTLQYYTSTGSLLMKIDSTGFDGTIAFVSPAISFTTASSGTYYLSFAYMQRYFGNASFTCVDYSTDGGTTWHRLTKLITTGTGVYTYKWLYSTFPLPLPASTSVDLQVRINITGHFPSGTYLEPFYIDDVWIFLQ